MARVEKQVALQDLKDSNLSYLLNLDGTFIGAKGIGHAQVLPPSSDQNATAEAFAKQAFGGNVPLKINSLTIKGQTGGWYATFANGMVVTYRPAGAASFRTSDKIATVEVNTNAVKTLNGGKPIKFKFQSW